MLIMLVAIVVSVVGLAVAVFALLQLGREVWGGQADFGSRRTLSALSFLGAGCLLAIGGEYKLNRELRYQSERAERIAGSIAAMSFILQEPVGRINVQVMGDNPFADQRRMCSLRLRVVTKSGSTFVSEITRSQMKPLETADADSAVYQVAWQSVLGGVTSTEGRTVADRLGYINDLRAIDHVKAEVVVRGAERVPMPDSVVINFHESQPVAVFEGEISPKGPARKEDAWESVYEDKTPLADKIANWAAGYFLPGPEQNVGVPLGASLTLGIILLIVGVGLFLAADNPMPAQMSTKSRAGLVEPVNPAPFASSQTTPPPTPSASGDLRKAVGLRIGYTVNNKTKVLNLNGPAEVEAILALLTVMGEEKKLDGKFFPLGTVDFLLPDQKEIKAKLVSPTQIEIENWGQIFVREDFYDKICAIVSQAEGKPVDVLRNNRL